MGKPTIHLRLLGGFSLGDSSGDEPHSLPHRRAQAVLAILAVCGKLGCSRDRLTGYLWPDGTEGQARHNLRDALYAIRNALGREAVLSAGETVRLNSSVVRSDVAMFAEALNDGRWADAMNLYRGPFLDGFHIRSVHDFELWVEDQRTRLLRERQQAVKALAKKAEGEERWGEAAGLWARAAAVDRFNSRLAMRRMTALVRAGDRANAVIEGEEHCRVLKSELDLEPDPAFLEELQRIRIGKTKRPQYFTPPPIPPTRAGS